MGMLPEVFWSLTSREWYLIVEAYAEKIHGEREAHGVDMACLVWAGGSTWRRGTRLQAFLSMFRPKKFRTEDGPTPMDKAREKWLSERPVGPVT